MLKFRTLNQKRHHQEWKVSNMKINASHTITKWVVCRVYKELLKINWKKTNGCKENGQNIKGHFIEGKI